MATKKRVKEPKAPQVLTGAMPLGAAEPVPMAPTSVPDSITVLFTQYGPQILHTELTDEQRQQALAHHRDALLVRYRKDPFHATSRVFVQPVLIPVEEVE